MSKVNLELMDDEGIVLSYDGELYWNDKPINEVYLTNKNLIVVNSKGIFNVTYIVDKFPLSEIKVLKNEPQIGFKGNPDCECYDITICFKGKNEELAFGYEFLTKLKISIEAKKWYINLCNLVYEHNGIDKTKSVLSDFRDSISLNKIKKK